MDYDGCMKRIALSKAARMVGIPYNTFLAMSEKGEIRRVKIGRGRKWFISIDDLVLFANLKGIDIKW